MKKIMILAMAALMAMVTGAAQCLLGKAVHWVPGPGKGRCSPDPENVPPHHRRVAGEEDPWALRRGRRFRFLKGDAPRFPWTGL